MTAKIHPPLEAGPGQGAAQTANPNQTGHHSSALNADHRVGGTIDTADQLSSVTLLGLAVAGAAAAILLHALLG
ncbi:hypothetical protein [Methylobacterium iners]|jgi:hypothetical protein|uniref:Uncharacterized protein n=1 Tax=Methylobacterium iners TaxID=418707 RepID=A0ABQ4RUT6_9HYPH|nr:hypothetical protein [Methylobacterium iners]GJD93438.1 hypothetical protein OCOJLMKI_0632 [Methylobacterium iners]